MALVAPLRSLAFSHGSEWYEISDEYDDSVTGFSGSYYYYGYLNAFGKWIIQQYKPTTGAYRYVNGTTGYAAAWALAIAGSLSYGYYNTITNASN